MSRREEYVEQAVENLYRLREVRVWLRSNVLFPMVPDSIVHPLLQHLAAAEHALLNVLYDYDAIDRVVIMQKTQDGPPQIPAHAK